MFQASYNIGPNKGQSRGSPIIRMALFACLEFGSLQNYPHAKPNSQPPLHCRRAHRLWGQLSHASHAVGFEGIRTGMFLHAHVEKISVCDPFDNWLDFKCATKFDASFHFLLIF